MKKTNKIDWKKVLSFGIPLGLLGTCAVMLTLIAAAVI